MFIIIYCCKQFLLSEDGVWRKIDDVWNMDSNCSAFKSIESQYCRTNKELLPEELVNFAIEHQTSTSWHPGVGYKHSWEGEFTGESLKVEMGRLSTGEWWLLVWKAPWSTTQKERRCYFSSFFYCLSWLLPPFTTLQCPISYETLVMHYLTATEWLCYTHLVGAIWDRTSVFGSLEVDGNKETNMHVSRKTGWDKRFVQW